MQCMDLVGNFYHARRYAMALRPSVSRPNCQTSSRKQRYTIAYRESSSGAKDLAEIRLESAPNGTPHAGVQYKIGDF